MLMTSTAPADSAARNHPAALRMAVIAFIGHSFSMACIYGSFSVLLSSAVARLEVDGALGTLALPLVGLAMAIFAPITGQLATRYSLRLMMLIGASLSVGGFVLLATTAYYPLYLIAYGLFLGPGMALCGVLSVTLVTRWFVAQRGRALGIVCTPIIIMLVPLASSWVLQSYGVQATYTMLALLAASTLVAAPFIIDYPPNFDGASIAAVFDGTPATPPKSMIELMRAGRFWALLLAFGASVCGSIILATQIVPIAQSWGFPAGLGATLLSVMSLGGILGPFLFGWVADRLGGAMALALVILDSAALWALLLLGLPASATIVVVALIGMHAAAAIPVLSAALTEGFGRESFSRAFGLANMLNLPFAAACAPVAATVYSRTGSYAGAIIGEMGFLAVTGLLLLANRRFSGKA